MSIERVVKIGKKIHEVRDRKDELRCWICGKLKPCSHFGMGGRKEYIDYSTPQTFAEKMVRGQAHRRRAHS